MALFTSKADANLHVLTMTAQVSTESCTEMRTFYAQCARRLELVGMVDVAPLVVDDDLIEAIAKLCKVIQILMKDIAQGDDLDDEATDEAFRWLKEHQRRLALASTEKNPAGKYPTQNIVEEVIGYKDGVLTYLVDELYSLLRYRNAKPPIVLLCSECKSPFLRTTKRKDKTQKFCSHRCAARSAERNRWRVKNQKPASIAA